MKSIQLPEKLSDIKLEIHTSEGSISNVYITDDEGALLRGQRHVSIHSHYDDVTEVVVTFLVDGEFVKIIPTQGKDDAL